MASSKAQIKKEWPKGMRVVISSGNLYTLGRVIDYGRDKGEPWVRTDDGIDWSAFDVGIRKPTKADYAYFRTFKRTKSSDQAYEAYRRVERTGPTGIEVAPGLLPNRAGELETLKREAASLREELADLGQRMEEIRSRARKWGVRV